METALLATAAAFALFTCANDDYVQHKFAPGTPGADGFYRMLDVYLPSWTRWGRC